MNIRRRFRPFHYPLMVLVVSLSMLPFVLTQAQQSSPQSTVEHAWQRAKASGSYRYQAAIEQTTYPAASITSLGRTPQIDRLALEGAIDGPQNRVELSLWNGTDRSPVKAHSSRLVDGRAEQRTGLGDWQPTDAQQLNTLAPGGNVLSFLAGADDFVALGSETRQFDTAIGATINLSLQYAHYGFRLDGAKLADALSAPLVSR